MPEITLELVLGALLIGSGVGVLTGMFGVGGGFLITPLLNAVLGIPMPLAVGTGAMQILGTATAGIYRRRHEGRIDFKIALVLFGGSFMGVRLGDGLVQWLKGQGDLIIGGQAVPAVDLVIQCVFLVLLTAIAGWLWYDSGRHPETETVEGLFTRIRLAPYTRFPTLDKPMSIIVMSYLGLVLGFLTGLLGIGGGVILMPALVYLVGMRPHQVAATDLAVVFLSSLVATATKAGRGDTSLALLMPLLIGSTIGLQVGVSAGNRTSGPRLKRLFTLVVVAAAGVVVWQLATTLL